MRRKLNTLLLTSLLLFVGNEAKANIADIITLDTAPLIGDPAGPFSVFLVFIDGSTIGDANNTVTVSNVQFGGGSGLGNPFVFGGASGSLETGVSITDSSFVNLFIEGFTSGTQLTFTLGLTSNDDLGIPDRLAFSILDNTGTPIPTLAPAGDYFWGVDIHSTGPVFDAYASDLSRTTIFIPAPTITPIPEPATLCFLGTSVGLVLRQRRFSHF